MRRGIEADENSIDRIEIVKGPAASLTYGSDALATRCNLIPAPPVPQGTIKGEALVNYQSNNGLYGESAAQREETITDWYGAEGKMSHKNGTLLSKTLLMAACMARRLPKRMPTVMSD